MSWTLVYYIKQWKLISLLIVKLPQYITIHLKVTFNNKTLQQQIGLKLNEEISEMLHVEPSFVWCKTWTVRKVYQIYLDGFKIWCWRRTKKNIWADRVKHESTTDSQGGEKHLVYNKTKGG